MDATRNIPFVFIGNKKLITTLYLPTQPDFLEENSSAFIDLLFDKKYTEKPLNGL